MDKVVVKKGREKSLRRHHPWLFSGAVERVEGAPGPGDTVEVVSREGSFLGRGAYSSRSQIRVRIWTFDPAQEISAAFFRTKIAMAVQVRRTLGLLEEHGACRIVNGESDGLPGLIVDRYADFLVCQFLTTGAAKWKEDICVGLKDTLPIAGVYERSDTEARSKEGLHPSKGLLWGEEPPEQILIEEGPCRFAVDPRQGHKTGFYLDQRDNRRLMLDYARGAEVLNCFAYSGAFGMFALKGGARRVIQLEASPEALALARMNTEMNGFDPDQVEHREGNVFQVLREYREQGRRFDLIVLDPPRFIESMKHLEAGSRGYKDINLLAFGLLSPGGLLFTFSCSGLMPPDLFQKIVADAALDAGKDAQIIRRMGQAPDHPTALSFPEGAYLKGFLCRIS